MTNSVETDKKYYYEINIARGIAVLFVLIGHSFPHVSEQGTPGPLELLLVMGIYYFHMALFMFLSGFVASKKLYGENVNFKNEIIKNAKRMLVPYFFYSFATFALKQVFSVYANNKFELAEFWRILLGNSPNGGLWFLWSLFVLSAAFLLLRTLKRKSAAFLGFGIALLFVHLVFRFPTFEGVLRYVIYYALGVVFAKHYDKLSQVYKRKVLSKGVFVLFPALAFVIIGLITAKTMYGGTVKALYPITAVLGIYAVMDVSLRLSLWDNNAHRFLNTLGDYSYDIYLLSYFVQIPIRVVCYTFLDLPYALVVAAMLLLGGFVPFLLSKYFLRKINLLSGLMLGIWNQK